MRKVLEPDEGVLGRKGVLARGTMTRGTQTGGTQTGGTQTGGTQTWVPIQGPSQGWGWYPDRGVLRLGGAQTGGTLTGGCPDLGTRLGYPDRGYLDWE